MRTVFEQNQKFLKSVLCNGKVLGLAPMAGITDMPMRVLCYRQGATYACSEMVSAIGYMCAKSHNTTYLHLLQTHPEETNTACQLFGRDPIVMGEAADRITKLGRFTSIDINMGCPARKVTSSGEGSALLKNPELAYKLMVAVRSHTTLPVTVKTRLGFDEDSRNALLLVKAAEQAGMTWVCVHGRTRAQQYAGRADYAAIAAIKRETSIPVLANGDVFTASDVSRILKETGADGLMIGRGCMGNPWLFAGAEAVLMEEAPPFSPSLSQKVDTAFEHASMMVAYKGEGLGIVEMRKHVGHYISGVHGASVMRRALNQTKTIKELSLLLHALTDTACEKEDSL